MTDDMLNSESSIPSLSSSVGSRKLKYKGGRELDAGSRLSQPSWKVEDDERLCDREECSDTMSSLCSVS